jgi:hypothetical protein
MTATLIYPIAPQNVGPVHRFPLEAWPEHESRYAGSVLRTV